MLFLCWTDDDNAALRSISAREWLLETSTWVIGAPIPETVGFPELRDLNSDHCGANKMSNSDDVTASGMDSATLPWTPDEYLFRVLTHNKASLPVEALQTVRFWSLKTWYVHDSYDELCAPQDADTKDWLQSLEPYATVSDTAMKHVDVDALMPYYLGLADKYLPPVLQW